MAQGCPLSALAGNIFLRDFDAAMNADGAICLRYIDDFILLCRSEADARRAMHKARTLLQELDLSIYDPNTHPDKAFIGPFSADIHFLGHKLVPRKYPPTEDNIASLMRGVELDVKGFEEHVSRLRGGRKTNRRQSYAATIAAIDQRVMAWAGAFSAATCEITASRVDEEIDRHIGKVINLYLRANKTTVDRRRLLGVHSVLGGMVVAD